MQASIIPFRPLQAQSHDAPEEFVMAPPVFQADNSETLSSNHFQDGWIISYVDILTLLLTLFVILLAMSHFSDQQSAIPEDRAEFEVARVETNEKVVPAAKIKPEEILINSIQRALQTPQAVIEKTPASDQQTKEFTITTTDNADKVTDALAATYDNQQAQSVIVADMLTAILPEQLSAPVMTARPESELAINLVRLPEPALTSSEETIKSKPPFAVGENRQESPASMVAALHQDEIINQLKRATSGTNLEIQQTLGDVNITISDDMLFPSGSEALKPDAVKSLSDLARIINDSGLEVSVEGHTDNTPISNQQFKSNWELSAARATTVTRLLIEQQVNPANIRAIGYADTRPRADNTSEAGRNQNRRVTIILHMPRNETIQHSTEM